ncbi:MAG: 5'-nucleotidase C-terminal domain-containing protein [Bacteroidia bacterium]|nr:5'-nucleotidase C-terminal domain-containing protein [Bacteroidia bacterium]
MTKHLKIFKAKSFLIRSTASTTTPKVFKKIFNLLLLLLLLTACHTKKQYTQQRYPAYQIGIAPYQNEDSLSEAIIAPYRAPMAAKMQETIVVSQHEAVRGLPEGSLGNLVCDLLLEKATEIGPQKPDVCIMNSGGLRIDLPAGNISRSMIYELMPFENELVLAEISGAGLLQLLKQIAARGGAPVGGIRMKITPDGPSDIYIGNNPLDTIYVYKLISSYYILQGGDRFVIPPLKSSRYLNIKVRDALLETLEKKQIAGQTIKPQKDGRMVSE